MGEKTETVSVFGIYTLVEIFQLDEVGNKKPGSQFAVMNGGKICFGPCDCFSEAKDWAIAHKDDLEMLPNEAAEAAKDSLNRSASTKVSHPWD